MTAVETEYSLWTRDPEDAILPTVRRLGIGFVAYSPLGRGFLTGQIRMDQLSPDDFRTNNPRFAGGNFEQNLRIVNGVEAVAREVGATPAQVALACSSRRATTSCRFRVPSMSRVRRRTPPRPE